MKNLMMTILVFVVFANNKQSNLVLVNYENCLSKNYVPADLVYMENCLQTKDQFIQREVYEAYYKMYIDAENLGLQLVVYSSYRSYERQCELYTEESLYTAKPGCSEHQTGLALDVSTFEMGLIEEFKNTPEGKFLKNFAHNYGFIIRYPKNKEYITKIAFEPWHIRYVGIKDAKNIYEKNICLEEYIKKSP